MGRIVVGIDGSDTSRRALRWAIEEGRLRQSTVEAVHSWHQPYVAAYPFAAASLDPELYQSEARELIERVVGEEDQSGLPAPVERIVVEGPAASSLLDSAKGADLLVVGSRGLGGFSGLLLGSVSHQVVQHAACPVVVIPHADT